MDRDPTAAELALLERAAEEGSLDPPGAKRMKAALRRYALARAVRGYEDYDDEIEPVARTERIEPI